MRPARSVVAALLLAITVSCSGGSHDNEVPQPSGSATDARNSTVAGSAPDGPTAAETIAGFDDGPVTLSRSISAVNQAAVADPDGLRRAALSSLSSTAQGRRFASVLALTMTASTDDPASVDALRSLSMSADVTERLLAAGALAALGDKSGVDVLIDALDSQETLRNVDPPFAAWRYARANLLLLVAQDLGLVRAGDARAAAAVETAWRTWWADHSAELTWNAELGRYEGSS